MKSYTKIRLLARVLVALCLILGIISAILFPHTVSTINSGITTPDIKIIINLVSMVVLCVFLVFLWVISEILYDIEQEQKWIDFDKRMEEHKRMVSEYYKNHQVYPPYV